MKKYNFDIVYPDLSICEYYDELSKVCKVYPWIKYRYYNINDLISLLKSMRASYKVEGFCLDYIRCKDEDYGLKGLFYNLFLYRDLSHLTREVLGVDFHACFKQEVFNSFLGNETLLSDLNRAMWGQNIILHKKFFSKILLMGYFQEYGVTINKMISVTKALQKKYGDKIVPIHQTYKDNPVVDYTIIWHNVIKASKEFKDNSYFRLSSCNPLSFS